MARPDLWRYNVRVCAYLALVTSKHSCREKETAPPVTELEGGVQNQWFKFSMSLGS